MCTPNEKVGMYYNQIGHRLQLKGKTGILILLSRAWPVAFLVKSRFENMNSKIQSRVTSLLINATVSRSHVRNLAL